MLIPPPSLCEQVPEIPSSVEQVINKALAKEAEQRFPDVLSFACALEEAARSHRLQALPRIKAKTEENILKGIAMLKRNEGRTLFPAGWVLAEGFLTALRGVPQVARAEVAGSLRRAKETLDDR